MLNVVALLLIGIPLIIFTTLILFTIQGAPFARSRSRLVQRMITLSQVRKGEHAVDLGSGDGVLVMALAQKGAKADGFEINPYWVWRSRQRIKKLGLEKNAHIYWKSFWSTDVSSYDVVMVYGIKHIMGRLEKKLKNELQPGSRVVSNYYVFPAWKEEKKDGIVRLYRKK